jgi:hypothetical protein
MTKRDQILLVALADGTLSGRRRARAEARLQEIPDGARLLERQRRVRRALSHGPVAPRFAEAPAPRWVPRLALAGAAVAVLLAVLVALPTHDEPIVAQAADLAHASATQPAPASAGRVLKADVDGVPFPDWSREFGWNEAGSRRDALDGRVTKTVFYEHMGHRLAYTILPGKPAEPPADAVIVNRNGVEIAITKQDGHDVAVFERDGHTCVLAGHVIHMSTLIDLASWKEA